MNQINFDTFNLNIFKISSFILAQSANDAAKETAEQTKDLITKITTWKIGQGLIVVAISYITIKVIDKLVIWLSEQVAKEWRLRIKQFLPFLRMMVLTFTIIILMNLFLNISRENLIAVTGTVAVALGFAFKDYVSSIIAGIIGLFEAPYRVGDRIQIEDFYGEVIGYGLRGIRLQTPEDNVVTIPHNKIWTDAVSNANMGELEAQVVTEFYFAHEVDVELVQKILYRVAYTSKYTYLKLPILVIIEENPWGTLFKLKSYPLDARDEFIYKTDLTTRAKRAFGKYNLPYPRLMNMEES
ncbi:mechanosensitive ion channel family protein [Rivularia sp. UHCC 0363]|uniref:mechanosensitive ion channel family protein n=1 Tax=Rivularia sp. UHCC 0363 TaxID=3110244 RepID=UPI002B20BF4A|nr:mechanosensitive ion channel family protein [Rivularia sp. UHCC 0363]MEA5593527.1 mechanosensitive ion channel family protein [Rivularia sp. UHCC 0363]